MRRAVLDTNVIVSAIVSLRGPSRQIFEAWRQKKFILLTSKAIIAEVVRVLRYPHLSQKYQISEADIQAVVASLSTDAYLLEYLYEVQHSRDPDDDIFLACSLEGKADYLVSGDTHLLEIKYYHGTQIVNPRDGSTWIRGVESPPCPPKGGEKHLIPPSGGLGGPLPHKSALTPRDFLKILRANDSS